MTFESLQYWFMAQMTFEALVDWFAEESANGDQYEFDKIPTPTDGAPNASEFFSMLTDAIGDLGIYGEIIDRDGSEWLLINAFKMYYVRSYDYDIEDAFKTMAEVHEYIDFKEEEAEEQSQNIKDTFEDLKRWSDDGC